MFNLILCGIGLTLVGLFAIGLWLKFNYQQQREALLTLLTTHTTQQQTALHELKETVTQQTTTLQQKLDQQNFTALKTLQESLQLNFQDVRQQLQSSLASHAEQVGKQVEILTVQTNERLKEITGEVEKRLSQGFEKTTATFADVIKRLAMIDSAQQKISELSKDVVSLNTILNDKRSRGAFGEVQLTALIRNMMAENSFALQHTLSNNARADCMLYLPAPTGNIVIDAKFPLESYQKLMATPLSEQAHREFEQQFKIDIRKHIDDIKNKYIIPGETADGAMMFIPAEAIFAEIHANFADLINYAQQAQVWLVSPTTMMAVLTTARAVLKDAATRKQIHIIQDHLKYLAKDFGRFQDRMDDLAKHIDQAQHDVEQVHRSAKKISSRFNKIETVDLAELEQEQPALCPAAD